MPTTYSGDLSLSPRTLANITFHPNTTTVVIFLRKCLIVITKMIDITIELIFVFTVIARLAEKLDSNLQKINIKLDNNYT